MYRKHILWVLVYVTLLTSCEGFHHIYSDYDRTVDFSKYKSFAWLPDKDSSSNEFNNQIIRNNARGYFNNCMAIRGYKIDTASPAVLFDLVISTMKEEKTIITPVRPFPTGWYYHNPFYTAYPGSYFYHHQFPYIDFPPRNYIIRKFEYTKSTITLNIIDRKENKLVWTGTAMGDIYDPSNIEYNLLPAIYDILDHYPVKPLNGRKKLPDYP